MDALDVGPTSCAPFRLRTYWPSLLPSFSAMASKISAGISYLMVVVSILAADIVVAVVVLSQRFQPDDSGIPQGQTRLF